MNVLKLAQRNRDKVPESWDALYGKLVEKEFRKEYSQSRTEAIVNNYLDDPSNEAYLSEMKAMQDYRKQCKAKVKAAMQTKLHI